MPITIDPTTLSAHFESKEAEDKWDRIWEERGIHRFDEAKERRDVRRRHAAADGLRVAPRRARLQLHADGRPRAPPPHAGEERLLPDGLGRQRPPDRAPRAELLPREVRAARPLRARAEARDGGRRRAQAAGPPRLARELHRAVPRPDRRGREGLQGALAAARALGRLEPRVLDDRRERAPRRAVELPRPLPQGPGLPGRGADAVGRGLPHRGGAGRGGGPPAARRLPRRALRRRGRRLVRDRDDAARAARRRASASPRTPTTIATGRSSASGRSRRSSACRCRSSRASSSIARRARASSWSARSATRPTCSGGASSSSRCGRWSAATAASCRCTSAARAGRASTPRRRPPRTASSSASRSARRRRGSSSCCATPRARPPATARPPLVAEPRPLEHPVKFYEKGDRPLEFITTRQWFVRILEHKQALVEAGERVQWHPDFMRLRFRNWTENLNLDWCISRQRYFGVPFPLWYAVAAGRLDRLLEAARRRREGPADRPRDRGPAGLPRGRSATSRAASVPRRTSSTRGSRPR